MNYALRECRVRPTRVFGVGHRATTLSGSTNGCMMCMGRPTSILMTATAPSTRSASMSTTASSILPFALVGSIGNQCTISSRQSYLVPQQRSFSGGKHSNKQPNKKGSSSAAVAGRIAMQDYGQKQKKSSSVKLCQGCGVEILGAPNSPTHKGSRVAIAAGEQAVDPSRSKRTQRMARYADVFESAHNSVFCSRCKSLREGIIWDAYDALRDVDPSVFFSQLKHVISRRRFGMCIAVVDATDPEFTVVKKLRDAIGKIPCLLVVNKVDLLPSGRLDQRELNFLKHRVEQRSAKFVDAVAVSSVTGQGMVQLAEKVLGMLKGRDVFVVGSANVGKSSLVKQFTRLMAEMLWYKSNNLRQLSRRKETLKNLQITSSHLPGTTLQSVRVPCFPSSRHALWDTPGIINKAALDYCLFPSHLMEPLAFPRPIHAPTQEDGTLVQARVGQSILIQAGWIQNPSSQKGKTRNEMNSQQRLATDGDDGGNEKQASFTLARLDVISCDTRFVDVAAFVPTSLKIRVVPTSEAPTEATIPTSYVQSIQNRIGKGSGNFGLASSRPLTCFVATQGPNTLGDGTFVFDFETDSIGSRVRRDIVFARLGWLLVSCPGKFGIKPWCVKESLFSFRRPLYPSNLAEIIDTRGEEGEDDEEYWQDDSNDLWSILANEDSPQYENIRRRLRDAVDRGRQTEPSNKDKGGGDDDFFDFEDDEYF